MKVGGFLDNSVFNENYLKGVYFAHPYFNPFKK